MSRSHLLIFIKIYNHQSISVRFVKVSRVIVLRWREAAYLALSPRQSAKMRRSTYQVVLSVHANTHQDSWILLLQVHIEGVRRELDSVVSTITITSSQAEVEAEPVTCKWETSAKEYPLNKEERHLRRPPGILLH